MPTGPLCAGPALALSDVGEDGITAGAWPLTGAGWLLVRQLSGVATRDCGGGPGTAVGTLAADRCNIPRDGCWVTPAACTGGRTGGGKVNCKRARGSWPPRSADKLLRIISVIDCCMLTTALLTYASIRLSICEC